jgi:neutral ceramidase
MNSTVFRIVLATFASLVGATAPLGATEPRWTAGAAKVDITPDYPVRLSGYGGRRTEFEGVEQHIFAKALALRAGDGPMAVVLTVDNCGVPGHVRDEVARRLKAKAGVPDERVALCSSHTHSAPMLGGVLATLFSTDVPEDHAERIARYTKETTDKLEQVALAAIATVKPCDIAWANGEVGFAMNRRFPTPTGYANKPNPEGPTDHALPVLRVTSADGKVVAILTGYACHCTTTGFNRIHGDWAGCAQEALEKEFPGAIALTALGCAGDQNPNPRGTYELANQHGQSLATEAARVVKGTMQTLAPALACAMKRFTLPFDTLPTREEFEKRVADKKGNAYHAKKQLERLDRGEKLMTELPYSVQTWSFGNDLAMVFLPGEVVVDYSLRLKRECDGKKLWVNAYSNDVPCYIPSRRVWEEGGYEAASAMLYYDRPTRLAPQVEELIIGAVREILPAQFQRAAK